MIEITGETGSIITTRYIDADGNMINEIRNAKEGALPGTMKRTSKLVED